MRRVTGDRTRERGKQTVRESGTPHSMRSLVPLVVFAVAGCPTHTFKPPSPLPTAGAVLAKLAETRAARRSFRSATVMDYWMGKERVKGRVLVMGTAQRQVRFTAEKPDGGTLLDMACNGTDFTSVDMQANCKLVGPCDKQTVARMLRVELEPDDFHHLAQGTPPVLADATGTVTWDDKHGYERVSLTAPTGKQTIVIDARDGRSDVIASELVDTAGKVVWSVEFTDFQTVKDVAGVAHRVPGRTRFKNPAQSADLIIEWLADEIRAINLTPDPEVAWKVPNTEMFQTCGGGPPP